MEDNLNNEMLQEFLVEADEHISSLEQNLLAIESNPSSSGDVINEIFRSAHTIKGMSGMMGFDSLNKLTHKMENVLDKLRNKTLLPSSFIIDTLFACLDSINAMIASIKKNNKDTGIQISELIKKLEDILEGKFEQKKSNVEVRKIESTEPDKKDEENDVNTYKPDAIYQTPEIIASFKDETLDIIEKYSSDIQLLENFSTAQPDKEVLDSIFRSMHTLKGLAAMFGFDKISKFAHKLENVLESIKNRRLKIDDNIYEFLLSCTDLFYAMLKEVEEKTNIVDLTDSYNFINEILNNLKEEKSIYYDIPENIFKLLKNEDFNLIAKGYEEKNKLFLIKMHIQEEFIDSVTLKVTVDKLNLFGKVVGVFSDTDSVPELDKFNPDVYKAVFKILLLSSDNIEVIKEVFDKEIDEITELKRKKLKIKEPKKIETSAPPTKNFSILKSEISEIKEKEIFSEEPVSTEEVSVENSQSKPENKSEVAEEHTQVKPPVIEKVSNITSTTVRVDIERLDRLMNLVGELVIDRTRLTQVIHKLILKNENELLVSDLRETTERMARITNELREAIMQTRMVPIGNVFNKYPRVVRDLSKSKGKQVNLEIFGETTELDKTIIEEIGDPMVHLIRNAIDHGIETPDERKKKGKKAAGILKLNAYHEGNHIIIEVEDDGAGIEADKIKKSALKKGIITQKEANNMKENEIINLIFQPGFSTAEVVTDISGRGVGLDVVKSNIKKLNGIIEIDTKIGRGTKFIIKLPLTLAIINALLIEVGTQIFAIPLAQVIESVIIKQEDIKTMEEREEVVVLREKVVTLLRLSNFFKIESKKQSKKIFVVIVGIAEERIGIIVDSLLGQQEIVIKSLNSELINAQGIAGATILGEGNVVLILDIASLIMENKKQKESHYSEIMI